MLINLTRVINNMRINFTVIVNDFKIYLIYTVASTTFEDELIISKN